MNEKKFKKFKKTPILLSAGFLAVALVAFLFVSAGIERNKALAEKAHAEWLTEESRRYEMQSLEILLSDISTERELIDSHFARSSNVVPFLDSMEGLARQVGAKPQVLSVAPSQDGQTLALSMRAEGSFESLYKFLELLELSPYELEFETVDIGKTGEGGSWEGRFEMKLISFIP